MYFIVSRDERNGKNSVTCSVIPRVDRLSPKYAEIQCQLDATDDIYCRPYCLLNMFRAPLCPSSGTREYYTDYRCLRYLVLWFQVVGMVWS